MIRITLLSLLGLLLITSNLVSAAPSEHCTSAAYGTSTDRQAIEDAMFEGTQQAVENAINSAKETRGSTVGCRTDVWDYAVPDITPPTLAQLETLWNNIHYPVLSGYSHTCANIGRGWPASALGGLHAKLGGYDASMGSIRTIAEQSEASQYSSANVTEPLVTYPGVFAYSTLLADANPNNICYRGGEVASQVNAWCGAKPSVCVTYDSGFFSGQEFLVEDFSINPREYGGAAAYDHAWSAALAVELWLQEVDTLLKAKYEASARLAADWSAAEPSVRNHNYTAKNIWVLAQLYQLTGELNYKTALQNKLDRNLKPGVLMDLDNNGLVDGMSNQPFSSLISYAQLPGRMWDGHNSNSWYHSMNALAAVEAYVAFRDSGDVISANDLRPYVIAMLDNLANEIVTLGLPAPSGEHMWPIPYSLLTALWKIAAYENEPHSLWESAAATLFNWGLYDSSDASVRNLTGRATASLALYMLYLSNTPYEPLSQRLIPPVSGASNPVPADLSIDIGTNPILSWQAGEGATSYDVYLGTSANFGIGDFLGNQIGTNIQLHSLLNDTTYYWRVDTNNASDTIVGAVWSFTTEAAAIEPTVLLDDSFESGSFSTEAWVTDWNINNLRSVSGSLAAFANHNSNNLESRTFNTSGYSKLTISFYYRDYRVDNSDNVYFQANNGAGFINVDELGNTSPESTWHFYSKTAVNSGSDSQFFHNNFKIRFSASGIDRRENLRIDDVKLIVE